MAGESHQSPITNYIPPLLHSSFTLLHSSFTLLHSSFTIPLSQCPPLLRRLPSPPSPNPVCPLVPPAGFPPRPVCCNTVAAPPLRPPPVLCAATPLQPPPLPFFQCARWFRQRAPPVLCAATPLQPSRPLPPHLCPLVSPAGSPSPSPK